MKNIYLLLIAVFSIISCKEEVPVDYVVLHGTIKNFQEKKFTFKSYDQEIKHNLRLDENGNFNDTIKLVDGDFVFFQGYNDVWLFLKQGDNFKITLDGNDFYNTLKIEGRGSEENMFKVGLKKISMEGSKDYSGMYNRDENDFKKYISEFKTKKLELINNSKGLSDQFRKDQTLNIEYSYLIDLLRYPSIRGQFLKDKSFKPSPNFFEELEELDKSNVSEINRKGSSYEYIVEEYYTNKFEEQYDKKDNEKDYYTALLEYLSKNVQNQEVRNSLLFSNTLRYITYTHNLDALYNLYSEVSSNEKDKDSITKIYSNLKVLSKGNVSPKFVNYENYAGGTTSLDDLKGKYVYIDVWATWCGPCKAEIPSLKKVEKLYHDKNIEFVSMSVDRPEDHDKWKKMVNDEALGGIQLYSDKDWSSEFVKSYLIKGIPRFILIDPLGNIISANAPRPSDEKLIDLFKELNI